MVYPEARGRDETLPEVGPLTKFLSDGSETRLDRFELIAELASGGMATVYLARLSGVGGFQRFVAIKRLHPHLAKENEFIEMFLDEARLAARIHHPNVVPIVEIGTSEQGYYLVMEYIEGDTLARLMARSLQAKAPLPPAAALRIVADALLGLHAAHELTDDDGHPLQIVHRDVSPQNILVGVDGTARITDFGVAKAASRLTTTRSGQLKGKLAYMAPEQARGKAVDRRADLFAMGIVLWEVLAHKRLFKGEGEADTLNRVLFEPIPTLRSAMPALPEELERVCAKALERDADARYATCAEFADAIEAAAKSTGLVATQRDVAAHLTNVLGTDVSQQREAVRAWLSRSEPSRPDARAVGTGNFPASRAAEVSSVSSAVLAVPGADPGSGSMPLPVVAPPERRSRAWLAFPAGLLLLGAAGAAAFFATRPPATVATPEPKQPVTVSATPTPPPPTPPVSAAAADTTAAPAPPPPGPASVATAKGTKAAQLPRRPPPPHGTTAATASPPPTTTATTGPGRPTLPDENPYR